MKVIDSNYYTHVYKHKYTIYQQFISNQFVKKLIPEWNWYKIYNKYFCIGCASLNCISQRNWMYKRWIDLFISTWHYIEHFRSHLSKYNMDILINLRNSTNSMIFVHIRFRISRICANNFHYCERNTLLQFDRRQVISIDSNYNINNNIFYAIVIINLIRYERITRGVDLRGSRFSWLVEGTTIRYYWVTNYICSIVYGSLKVL